MLRTLRDEMTLDAQDAVLLQALVTLKARSLTDSTASPPFGLTCLSQGLLCELHTRDAFTAQRGAEVLVSEVLSARARSPRCVAAAARAAAAAAAKHEDSKVALFKAGLAAPLLKALDEFPEDARLAASACHALTALATADDRRAAASAAFAHGRQLHKQSAYTPLMAVLRRHPESAAVASAACCALRATAVNDEACADIAEAGAVEAAIALLARGLSAQPSAAVTRAALSLLRQLAGADAVKARFAAAGGLVPLVAVLSSSCSGASAAPTCEAALALLAALSLRNPDFVTAAAASGALDATLDAMAAHPAVPGLQRAACMFLRNSAARNPDVRPMLRERGAEPLLRAAKRAHPALCADVGSAALRDLGADNYNEGWTPTTVYMGSEGQLFTYDDLCAMSDEEEAPGSLPTLAEEA